MGSATKEALGRRLIDTQKQLLKLQLQAKLQELEKLKLQTHRPQASNPAVASHPPMRPAVAYRPPLRPQPKAVFTPAATSPGKAWPVATTSPQKSWPVAKASSPTSQPHLKHKLKTALQRHQVKMREQREKLTAALIAKR